MKRRVGFNLISEHQPQQFKVRSQQIIAMFAAYDRIY